MIHHYKDKPIFTFTYGDRCQVYYEREYVKFCNEYDLTIDWKWFRREFNRRVKEGYFNEIR